MRIYTIYFFCISFLTSKNPNWFVSVLSLFSIPILLKKTPQWTPKVNSENVSVWWGDAVHVRSGAGAMRSRDRPASTHTFTFRWELNSQRKPRQAKKRFLVYLFNEGTE